MVHGAARPAEATSRGRLGSLASLIGFSANSLLRMKNRPY